MDGIRSIMASILFTAVFVFSSTHVPAAETCNRVVAIVNDEVITLHELNKKIKELTGLYPEDLRFQDRKTYLETRRRILELLIDDRIAQEKIRELGITVAPRQIDAAIEKIKQDNQWTHEELIARLERQGIAYEKYRDSIKGDLQRLKLIDFQIKSKIIIREEEIRDFYETHKQDFSDEGKVHLANIFLKRENRNDEAEMGVLHRKGKDILGRLGNGEDFAELARMYSQGPGAQEGGDLGVFKTVHLEPEVRKILEDMPEGGFSDLIIRPEGIQIIKLIEKEKGQTKTFKEARDAIYGVLYREEINKRYMSWIKKQREGCYTKIIF
jgi:peptidyl-prolyl cis-trans isomerase SurA